LDLAETINERKEKCYFGLALTWAFMAECDLGSEHLRCLGGARFKIYGAYRAFI